MRSRFIARLAVASVAMFGVTALPGPAGAAAATATIVQAHPETSCAGEPAQLRWTPPADTTGLTGYRIVQGIYTPATPRFITTTVRPDQTTLDFAIPFGTSIFQVYADTSTGAATAPYTSAWVTGNKPPVAMSWDSVGANGVSDGAVTISYKWYGPVTTFTTGGDLPATLRLSSAAGGATMNIANGQALSATTTLAGLTNGVDYTFSAVTSNACGSSELQSSPSFTPGIAPNWTRDTPPLRVGPGEYAYKFAAAGDPAPTYALLDAPSWLSISKGLVSGRPPAGTTSFAYSVAASNGVGIHPGLLRTDIVSGPFRVDIWAP